MRAMVQLGCGLLLGVAAGCATPSGTVPGTVQDWSGTRYLVPEEYRAQAVVAWDFGRLEPMLARLHALEVGERSVVATLDVAVPTTRDPSSSGARSAARSVALGIALRFVNGVWRADWRAASEGAWRELRLAESVHALPRRGRPGGPPGALVTTDDGEVFRFRLHFECVGRGERIEHIDAVAFSGGKRPSGDLLLVQIADLHQQREDGAVRDAAEGLSSRSGDVAVGDPGEVAGLGR